MYPAPLISLERVGKRFGDGPPVLSAIDLSIARGDFISFVGPSGCGKSTLLRLIAGLLEPSEGRIRISEVEATPSSPSSSGAFFVFQDPNLLPWRRAAGNVELPLQLRGVAREERRRKAAAMLDLVGLADAREKYPWQLSGGMKMRVSIARALTVSPEILLLDEPFGALDEMTRNKLNEDLLAIRGEGAFTACFVTHSVAEAVFLSNRVAIFAPKPGRIAKLIDVPFPYPRRAALRENRDYLSLLAEVTHDLVEAAST